MLKGISPLISPDLLATLHRMGHGDSIILADAHFPGHSINSTTLRADGLLIPDLLEAILPLFVLDTFIPDSAIMMAPVAGFCADPSVEATYQSLLEKHGSNESTPEITHIDRSDFYEKSKQAFAVVMTGDTTKYGNLILSKGVTSW